MTVSFLSIMLTRSDVQNELNALIEQEWSYWKDHKEEWMRQCVDPAVLWDGYHWHFVRCLVQAKMWEDVKHHIEGMGETYLSEQIQTLIHLNSPRLYQKLWGGHENVEGDDKKEEHVLGENHALLIK